MKFAKMIFACLAVGLSCAHATAGVVYSNTTTNLFLGSSYTGNSFTQIGDQIHLAGTERLATLANVEVFNLGVAAGTFDATLRLFDVGSPVGSQIGSDFVQTGVSAPGSSFIQFSFALPNVLVPDDLVFTLGISNQSAGANILAVLYNPPTIGGSDSSFLIANDGTNFGLYTAGAGGGKDNVYFELHAQAVPEPSSIVMLGLGALGVMFARRQRQQKLAA